MDAEVTVQAWYGRRATVHDDALWARWQACLERHWGGHAFLDQRFMRTAVEHFVSGDLWLYQCGADGEERVMLLLEQARSGVLRTFSPPQSQIAPLIIAPGQCMDVRGLFDALPRGCQRVDLFNIDPLFGQDDHEPAAQVDRSPYGVTISIARNRSFQDFWLTRGKKLRDNIGRYVRRARDQEGGLDFRVHDDGPGVLAAFARYAELESRGWKGQAGTAIHLENAQGAFYAEVLRKFAAQSQALAFELWLDDILIASRIAIIGGHGLVMLKTTFDEEFNRVAPGRVLLYLSLEGIFEDERVRHIEFYTNAQKEQLPWADSNREIANLSLYRYAAARRAVAVMQGLRAGAGPQLSYALERYSSFDDLPKSARTLWAGCGQRSVFSSLEWYENLYRHAGAHLGELAILAVQNRAEETLALLPCVSRASLRGGEDLLALSNYYSPRFDLVLDLDALPARETLSRLLRVLARQPGWDSLSLFPMHRSPIIDQLLDASREHLLGAAVFFETANWSEPITSLDEYHAARPAQLRATLRRKAARLGRSGAHHFRILSTPRDVAAAMAEFKQIYDASWKQAEPHPDFMGDLAQILAHRRLLRLGLLYIGECPVAAQFWVVENRTACIYKLAYDEQYAQYSPGTLLTMHMLESVVQQDQVNRIDYLTGDDAYKRDWMSVREEMLRLRITNPRRARGLYLAGYDRLRTWKHRWDERD